MKKIFFICAALALGTSAFAQKSNLRKIENITYGVTNLQTLEPEKWTEIKQLVNEAKADPETAENHQTWEWIIKSYVNDRFNMLKEYQANNNQFSDMKAFFMNEKAIVDACEKYYKLIQTPNEKGKMPLKEKELEIQKLWTKENANACRGNLYVGATQFVYNEPETAVELLESYYASFDSPMFAGDNLKETDKNYKESAFVYASALKGAKADEAKVVEWMEKSLQTQNGPLACQELITLYHQKEDKANETKYLQYGFENFKQTNIFGINLAQAAINDREYDKTIQICDVLIQRQEDGTTPVTDDAGNALENVWFPYYFKAVSLFNTEKFDLAHEAFAKGDEKCPGHIELVMGAGTSAAKYGNDHFTDKAVCKPWFEKAVTYFHKAEEAWPDQSDQWGYQMYACYHNLENKTMEAKYKKYAEK